MTKIGACACDRDAFNRDAFNRDACDRNGVDLDREGDLI